VNNTELYYDVAGAGHPLTLLHGMALDRSSWDDPFGVFAGQYRVVRYDMRAGVIRRKSRPNRRSRLARIC
jgi:pimeloyl-ACP methyl ester carboxylesterase